MSEATYEPASFEDFIVPSDGMRVNPGVQLQRDQVRLALLQLEQSDNPTDPFLPKEIAETTKRQETGNPWGDKPNRGSKIASELKASKASYEPMTFGGAPAPSGVTYEPMFPEEQKPAAAEKQPGVVATAGRGLTHGVYGLAEAVNTGLQFLGNRLGSSGIADQGASGAEYWNEKAKPFEPPANIQGAIFDKPELLTKGTWWAYNLAEMAPSFAAAIIPGVGAAKSISVAGKALKLTEKVIERLAIAGGSVVGGASGGALEGAQTYQEVLKRGAPEDEAAVAGSMMALASAALNAISVGKVISPSKASALRRFLTTGAVEGLTEWAEEPAEGAILGRTSVAKPEDDPVERAKQGLNVLPIAAVMGGGAGVMSGGGREAAPPDPQNAPGAPIAGSGPAVPPASPAPAGVPPGPPPGGGTPSAEDRAAAQQGMIDQERQTAESQRLRDAFSGTGEFALEPLAPIDQARVDAQILKAGGDLPGAGETRLKNATLLSIYGENAAVRHVIEAPDQFSAIADAMLLAAPTVERVRGTIGAQAGNRDITDDILTAVEEIGKIKESGKTVAEVLAEGATHDISYEGQQLVQFLDENAGNPKRLASFLESYLHEVESATGIPSEVRGRAFDIIAERNAARKAEEEKRQAGIKTKAFEKTETTAKREKASTALKAREQDRAERVLKEIAVAKAAGSGINPGHLTAIELAFKNAKPLKGKSNAKPSPEAGRDVQGAPPGGAQAGPGQTEAGRRAGAVPKPAQAGDKGNARPVHPGGDQPGAAGADQGAVNRGVQIASELGKNAPGTRANPVIVEHAEHIAEAAARAEAQPSSAQKEADNYRKGHFRFAEDNPLSKAGVISIETAKGGERTAHDGSWTVPNMPVSYGHLQIAEGADGDKADVFIGDYPKAPSVFVIDQINPDTGKYDETKSMLGFLNPEAARKAYIKSFSDGKGEARIGAITQMTQAQFVARAQSNQLKNAIAYKNPEARSSTPVAESQALAPEASDAGVAPGQAAALPDVPRGTVDGKPADGFTLKELTRLTTRGRNKAVRLEAEAELERRADVKASKPLSEKQIAARKRLADKAANRKIIDQNKDSLLDAIAKKGGINIRERDQIMGDKSGNHMVPFVGHVFSTAGMGLDDMATSLAQDFYLTPQEMEDGGVNALMAKVRDDMDRAIAGTAQVHFSVSRDALSMEQELRQRQEREEEQALAAEMEHQAGEAAAGMGMDVAPEDLAVEGLPANVANLVDADVIAAAMEQIGEAEVERLAMQHENDGDFHAAVLQLAQEKANANQRADEEVGQGGEEGGGAPQAEARPGEAGPAEVATAAAKELWQMTREEHREFQANRSGRRGAQAMSDYDAAHAEEVRVARDRGLLPPTALDQRRPPYGDQTQTEAFKRWSNNAPLIGSAAADSHNFKTGERVVVEAFHGTQRPDRVGNVFKKSRATSGPMAFHTSDPALASSYATGKSDTSLNNENTNYESWFRVKIPGSRNAVNLDRAWYHLPAEEREKIAGLAPRVGAEYETGDKPILHDEGTNTGLGGYDQHLKEARGNHFKALIEEWLSSGSLFNDEIEFMKVLKLAGVDTSKVEMHDPGAAFPFVYKNYIAMQNPLVTTDIPQRVTDALNAAAKRDRSREQQGGDTWDKARRTLRSWVEEYNRPADNAYVWTSIPDKVTELLKSLGYDGIIDRSGKGGGPIHPVYVPFHDTQIKSAIGNKGGFGDTANILKQNQPVYGQQGFALVGETEAEIRAREEAAKAEEKATMNTAQKAEAALRAVREKKEIAERSKTAEFTLEATAAVDQKTQREIDRKRAEDVLAGQNSLFQDRPAYATPWYYSELARAVEASPMKQGTAKAWQDYIKSRVGKGVKPEEIEATGINDWLATQEGKVTKEQVQAFMEQGGVKVAETMMGGDNSALGARLEADFEREGYGISFINEEEVAYFDKDGNEVGYEELPSVLQKSLADNYDKAAPPKFADYQLPGSVPGSYRELVLTLPDGPPKGEREALGRRYNELIAEIGARPTAPGVDALIAERNQLRTQLEQYGPIGWGAVEGVQGFESNHFPGVNYLAHTRVNDRILPDGRKVLFVEEIQSDRAQKGRSEGFKDDRAFDALLTPEERELRDFNAKTWTNIGEDTITEAEKARARYLQSTVGVSLQEKARRHSSGIVPAPFVTKTDSWTALVLKRLLRYAAEGNYDAIAWTRGEQQVERYTSALRKAVDTIEWKKTPEGVQIVGYKGRQGATAIPESVVRSARLAVQRNDLLGFDRSDDALNAILEEGGTWVNNWGDGVPAIDVAAIDDYINHYRQLQRTRNKVVDTTEKESALSDAIGKSMVDRIRNDPNQTGTIEGENITVSDTGMAGYYDRIVPKVAAEVAKKVGGGKVVEIDIGKPLEMGVPRVLGIDAPITSKQQAIEITPAMREKIMAGQALFQPKPAYNSNQLELSYEQAEKRPGTTQAQKDQGILALKGLFGRKRVAGEPGGDNAGGGTATLLGSALWRSFKERQGAELIGQEVRTPQDLATLAQILRDPRFETLRFFFVKDGKIVGHTGVTSRLPGSVSFVGRIAKGQSADRAFDREIAKLRDMKDRLKADGYYVLHNHPSGTATPSVADRLITEKFAEQLRGFKDHVVIDHDQYGLINSKGDVVVKPIASGARPAPEVAHDMLGKPVTSPGQLIEIAKRIQTTKGYAVLIGQAGSSGQVQAIAEVPEAQLYGRTTEERMRAVVRVRHFGRYSGSGFVFVVSSNPESHDFLIKNGVARDVVSTGGTSRAAMGVNQQITRDYQAGKMRAEQKEQGPYNHGGDQTDTAAFKAWFGDSKVVDAEGKPLVVYHGTPTPEFTRFTKGQGMGGPLGMWFASTGEAASRFATTRYADQGPAVYPVYLSIQNPMEYQGWSGFTDKVAEFRPGKLLEDKVKSLRRSLAQKGYDGIVIRGSDTDSGGSRDDWVAFRPEQIKSAIGNVGTFDPNNPSILEQTAPTYNVPAAAGYTQTMPKWAESLPQAQKDALVKAGVITHEKTLGERARELRADFGKKFSQGVFDQFAPLRELDYRAYMLARMSRGSDGGLEAMMMYGRPYMDGGALNVGMEDGGLLNVFQGLQGEHDRFMAWIAGNRAAQLKAEGRENLFTDDDISALKDLNQGAMPDGVNREILYANTHQHFNAYMNAILDIAEETGLIDAESREVWAKDFYVPFYRVLEDNTSGPTIKSGLVNQYAFKKLKGGKEGLHDLMANTLMNWSHLLSASLKNQAAAASLQAAEGIGAARPIPRQEKGAVSALVDGDRVWYEVDDPFLLDAITAMEWSGFKGPAMEALGKFKRALTTGVTVNPTFKIRNLLRDTVASIAQGDLSYNAAQNMAQGWRATAHGSQTRASMMASGGLMRFGSMLEGNTAEHTKRLINAGIDQNSILDKPHKVVAMLQKMWDTYQETGDRGEQVNRAALYEQLRARGLTHLEASFQARDLLDFSMQGQWAAIRFLTQVVPFMNARLQGMYKLGRAAHNDPARMAYVTGALALGSMALLLWNADDDDWKKREDWDRDQYWWFKLGGQAFRIPKPFEIGAIASVAERTLEYLISEERDPGKRFMKSMGNMVSNNLSMNPIPQLVKPLIDIYANKDSFTGRQIETEGMQNLSKGERVGRGTTLPAQILGKLDPTDTFSPVQVDFMARAYFGWLGTAALTVLDYGMRPFSDLPGKPEAKLRDFPVVGNFTEGLPANQSRYVTLFYDEAKIIHEAYADWRNALKMGDKEKAEEILQNKGELIRQEMLASKGQRALGALNRQERMIEINRDITPQTKRVMIDAIAAQKDKIARQLTQRARE